MRRPPFNAEEHLTSIAENGVTQLRHVPTERHAETAKWFLSVFMGARGALVGAGLLTDTEAAAIERRTTGPLLAAGGLQRVEASAESHIEVGIAAAATAPTQATPRTPAAPVRFRFDLSVEGLPSVQVEERARTTTAIREEVLRAAKAAVDQEGGRVSSFGWSVG